jgi:hypothetical protein
MHGMLPRKKRAGFIFFIPKTRRKSFPKTHRKSFPKTHRKSFPKSRGDKLQKSGFNAELNFIVSAKMNHPGYSDEST